MARKKTHLCLQRRKNAYTKRKNILSKVPLEQNTDQIAGKRKLTRTPIKSPYKRSPFSKVYTSSPAKKKIKVISSKVSRVIVTGELKKTPIKSPFKQSFRSPLYKVSPTKRKRCLFKNDSVETKPVTPKRCLELHSDDESQSTDTASELLLSEVESLSDHSHVIASEGNEHKTLQNIEAKYSYDSFQSYGNSPSANIRSVSKTEENVISEINSDNYMCEELSSNESTERYVENLVHTSLTELNSDNRNETDSAQDTILREISNILPDVLNELAENGRQDVALLTFLKQVKEKKFPLNNIAFLLWLEVVQWFDGKTTTNMRYSEQTKLFWKLGWRMFGGRFLNFMGGYKSHGHLTQNIASRGLYSPGLTEVNFVVPDHKILRKFDPFLVEGERTPGIYDDIIEVLSTNLDNQSACLTFDGKKIKMGLTMESGDVDLLGHETGETLSERKAALKRNVDEVMEMRLQLDALEDNRSNIEDLPMSYRSQLVNFLLHTLQRISCDIFEIREIRRKKEYCETKLIERGGENDWRKGKYVYAVSAIIAFLYDIDEYLKNAYAVTEQICVTVASLNDRKFVSEKDMNIYVSPSLIDIDKQKGIDGNPSENTRFMKQRSDEWFELRRQAKVTGSTWYTAIGGEGLKRQKDHFEKVICGIKDKEPSQEQKIAMEHGSANEINAVTTIIGKVIPVLEPALLFCEEGCVSVSTDNDVFMVVSPDGSLREDACISTTKVAIEIKCPYYKIHTEFPARYLLQCISQIEVLQVNYLLFVSWTLEDTVVFKVERDEDLFKEAMKLTYKMYGHENTKKPTKLSDEQKELLEKIKQRSKAIRVVARFSSLVLSRNSPVYEPPIETIEEVKTVLQLMKDVMETQYEIKRQRASEAVVFIVSGLDRSWDKESVKWSPVAWFPKGYSLNTETMRAIAEDVHDRCYDKGIHIPCASFDGQWHVIVVRSKDGKPLTKLQLQKDVWKQVVDMKKCEIIAELKSINKFPTWEYVMKGSQREVEIDNTTNRRVIEASNEAKYPAFRKMPRTGTCTKDSDKQSEDQIFCLNK